LARSIFVVLVSLLITLLAWGALAFGAVYPWAYWPLSIGSLTVGFVAWATSRAHHGPGPRPGLIGMLATAALVACVQILPFSADTLARLSPSADMFFRHGSVLGSRTALSLDPVASALSIIWLVSMTVLFVGCVRWFGLVGVHGVGRGVMVVGSALALIGIVQEAVSSGAIYGFWQPRFGGSVFGPFTNENHFAGWMIMALPVALGYFWAGVQTSRIDRHRDWRGRLLWLSSPAAGELTMVGVAAAVMGSSLVLTFSLTGITCFALALVLFGWFIRTDQAASSSRSVGLAYLLFVALVVIVWVGIDAIGQEFSSASWGDVGGRLTAWQDGLRIIQDFTLTGTGMNTYGTATLLYSADPTTRFVHAHNGYVQLLAEAGLVVGVPILFAVILFMQETRRRFQESTDDTVTYWLRVGSVTGLAGIALQEMVDFSLQMPGNMALFTVLCAIAVHPSGQSSRHRPHRRHAIPLMDSCAQVETSLPTTAGLNWHTDDQTAINT